MELEEIKKRFKSRCGCLMKRLKLPWRQARNTSYVFLPKPQ